MTDVLVIGGGLAGWRAAEAAVARGCAVTLVANGVGNSPEIHALNCPVLPEDSVERYIEDTLASGHGTNDPDLVRTLCEGAAALKDEFPFDRNPDGSYHTIQPLGSTVPRCVSIGHAIGAVALRRIRDELKGKVTVVEGRVVAVTGASRPDAVAADARRVAYVTGASRPDVSLVERANVLFSPSSVAAPLPRFPGHEHHALDFAEITKGEYLKHWMLPDAVYHVCFRLADSVPLEVQHAWREEREAIRLRFFEGGGQLTEEERERQLFLFREKVDEYLDAGCGECLLAKPGVAECLLETIGYNAGHTFALHAIGVMPNHLHVVFQLLAGASLEKVVDGWKSVSAHRINRLLGRTGDVWQADFYNRMIRDRDEYSRQMRYVVGNDMIVSWRMPGRDAPGTYATRLASALPVPGRDAPGTYATRLASALPVPGRDAPGTYATRLASGETLSARAVVIAPGGWCGKYEFSTNPAYLRGDGIAMAQALGAAVRDMDAVQYEPTVRVTGPRRGVPVITTLLYKGATLRNERGEAFLEDLHLNKDELSKAILAEMSRTHAQGVWYDLESVAEKDLRDCKMDPSERRIFVAPAPHTSLGGVVVDSACRVLDVAGAPIPGLFAAGEVTGGLHGVNRLGGNAGTETLVFGRISGNSAADFARLQP